MKTESLPVPLSQEEIAERANAMAEAVREIDELDVELKAKRDDIKRKREELETKMRLCARQVREKAEYREVEVEDRSNWETGMIETFRLDTGEQVRARPMTVAEKQRSFEHPSLSN